MKTKAILSVVALLTVAVDTRAAEAPPPDGCHWQAIPVLKAHLAVPNGWLFSDVTSGDVLAYEVRPAGPGLEGVRARYRLEVRRGVEKSAVVARAREFVESLRAGATEAQPLEVQHMSTLTLYSSFVLLPSDSEGVPPLSVALSSVWNSRTGTLYTMRFDIPFDELEVLAPLANHLFRTLKIDDEV